MWDKPHDECGVCGFFNNGGADVANELYNALFALQHRGQLSCGMALNFGDGKVDCLRGDGLVSEVFTQEKVNLLAGHEEALCGLGHVRYSPKDLAQSENTQPLVIRYARGTLCVSNNGCLTNAYPLRRELENQGAVFQTGSDAELIGYLTARERLQTESTEEALVNVMKQLSGAYSILLLTPHKLIAARDPQGFRPLCVGMVGKNYVAASESCAITAMGGTVLRALTPGEVLVISKNGMQSITAHTNQKSAFCVFEYVYFARSDSVIDGLSVHTFRKRAGEHLAKEHPVTADVVIGVPDSGIDAAIGFAHYSGIPFRTGFVKNRYIGRTLIQSTQQQREREVNIKLNAIRTAVDGKRVVLVDDSIVRGTTCARIVTLLREAGAAQVHLRVSSPPFLNPCYYGTDISSREYLIACKYTQEEIRQQTGADSLGYLSLEGLHNIARDSQTGLCDACFTGNYPTQVPKELQTDKYASRLGSMQKTKV